MSITVLQKEDIEADDILATLATQGAEQGFNVLVCSGDRDTIQLVNDDVTLLYPNVQGVSQLKRYDRAAVIERYGVPPEQYPDIAALVGETSDNLPGVAEGGREDRRQVARPVRLARRAARERRQDHRRRRRQPARAPRRRAPQPHAQPAADRRRAARGARTTSKCSRWTPRPCATSSRASSSRRSSRASPSSPASSSRWRP